MAAFFQLLRDRIFGRALIILPRQPEENAEEQKPFPEASENNKSAIENSETDETDVKKANKSTECITYKSNQNSIRTSDAAKKKLEVRNIY